MDARILTLITVGTMAVVGGLKKAFPSWVTGKEPLLAVSVPILFIIVCKVAGLFKETEWVDALIWTFGAGVGSGVLHDKVLNPLIANNCVQ